MTNTPTTPPKKLMLKMNCGVCSGIGKVKISDEYRGKIVYVDQTCTHCSGQGYKLSRNNPAAQHADN